MHLLLQYPLDMNQYMRELVSLLVLNSALFSNIIPLSTVITIEPLYSFYSLYLHVCIIVYSACVYLVVACIAGMCKTLCQHCQPYRFCHKASLIYVFLYYSFILLHVFKVFHKRVGVCTGPSTGNSSRGVWG